MVTPRVFLVWQHPLLRDTVQAILAEEGLPLVGDSHGTATLTKMDKVHPDVILVEDEQGLAEELLANLPTLTSSRLVCINLINNTLHIYQREERLLQHSSDLVTALQEG